MTEMNFDSDPNFKQPESFETSDGTLPIWADWTLLQPIFSGQTDKYHYARLAEELENSGIAMTWWGPIDIDGNGAGGDALTVPDGAIGDLPSPRTLFGYGGDDTITGTDTPTFEGLDRFSRTRGYVGHSDDPDNPLTDQNDFMGDKVMLAPEPILPCFWEATISVSATMATTRSTVAPGMMC